MARLTVEEASTTYESAMRNVLRAGAGVCAVCHTFIPPGYTYCFRCSQDPNELDVVVPITYSEHLGQMHHALRNYKDGYGAGRTFAAHRVAGILYRFLDLHEDCVAATVGVDKFDVVTTVPSSSPERDQSNRLRMVVGWCKPAADRLQRVLVPTGSGSTGREYDPSRYAARARLDGRSVLLIDDTWAAGGHAQSAAHVLREAGAANVAMIVVGRHVRPDFTVGETTCAELMARLPRFDWDRCCVHG